MKTVARNLSHEAAGKFSALLRVCFVAGLALALVIKPLDGLAQGVRDIDRGSESANSAAAAETATEKIIERLTRDAVQNGEASLSNNFPAYRALVPTTNDNAYWGNYTFTQPPHDVSGTWVGKVTNSQFVTLTGQYEGVTASRSVYRVASNARLTAGVSNTTASVWQDVAVETIPIFSFAVFYDSLLEFTWAATLTVRGPTHGNSDIYVGSSGDLAFSNLVTATGKILNPAWGGHAPINYTGNITYAGSPSPGYSTGNPALVLPLGTNLPAPSMREIINLPLPGEDHASPIGRQRYFNKAGMVILVTNGATPTNVVVTITLKSAPGDVSPLTFINYTAAWTNNGFASFLSTPTNVMFTDQREGQNMKATQIDIGALRTWMGTNLSVGAKFPPGNPLNIIYIADQRSTNSATNTAVRLINGQTLPTNGLTIATINPVYIKGHYNCPNTNYLGTTNTTASVPSSVVCDALTLLSENWSDAQSFLSGGAYSARSAVSANMTVNTAIISGMVYSTGPSGTEFSGGLVNQLRLLQNWTGRILTLNTSLVSLFNSGRTSQQWQSPSHYYNAPTRNWNFDTSFLQPANLPPGTPSVMLIERLRRVTASPTTDPAQ